MNIKIKRQEEKTTVFLSGNIDIPSAEVLKKKLFKVSEDGAKEIVLDFEEVVSVGSSGIGAIIYFYKQFATTGGKAAIINVNKEIASLFNIIKLDLLMEITPRDEPGYKK
ncbi:MAG: STAS domain-containing protein [Candidatus Aminicenantes bacterium]|nr:STAS domain-containing protein [Candidatus Aminicenantes bacterium]